MVKARCLKSNQSVVIKLINNLDQSAKIMKRTLREIQILRELSKVQNNIFTARLIDIFTTDLDKHQVDTILKYKDCNVSASGLKSKWKLSNIFKLDD